MAIAAHNRHSKSKTAFPNSSYELRTAILEFCSPFMTTSEAYTKTLDSRKFKDRNFLKNSSNWVPERTAFQAKIVANQLVLAAGLSKRLNHYVPSVWAVRGNTGSGKTTAVKNDPLFRQAIDDNGEMSGNLDPDIFKFYLKRKKISEKNAFLGNSQVHEEGVALFNAFKNGLKKDASNSSAIVEARLSTIEDFELNVLKPARKRHGEVLLLDIESPLLTSLNRVLARDPFGKDPCPPVSDIIKGYKESIIYKKTHRNHQKRPFHQIF